MLLITKVQYKNYEPGEFTEENPRSLEETLTLTRHFPWKQEKTNISFGLTNPSVTIHDQQNNYLKIAPFYNDKFILYLLTPNKKLHSRPLESMEEVETGVTQFYKGTLDKSTFRSQSTFNNLRHFQTHSFSYTISKSAILVYAILMGVMTVCLLSPLLGLGSIQQAPWNAQLVWLAFLILPALALTNGAVLFNHYRNFKDSRLVISRGQDIFYFGKTSSPEAFNKNDIENMVLYRAPGRRSNKVDLSSLNIRFTDGREINISGLMIDPYKFLDKLPRRTHHQSKFRFFNFIAAPAAPAL